MNTKMILQFEKIDDTSLSNIDGGVKVAPGVYCTDVNGRAKCSTDQKELWGYTGRVIVNGWVNYGPWAPRTGFGVIIP